MMKKRDILFLCQFFYPEYISSAILPFDTVKALNKAGFTVDVMCGYPFEYAQTGDVPVKECIDGIEIHRVKYIQMDRKGFLGRLVNYFSLTFMMFLRLFKLASYRSVVVYSNPPILPWIASWAKVLFGTKLIFVSYDLYPEVATRTGTLRDGNFICRLMNHINQCVFRRADGVVALSHEMKDYIVTNRPIRADQVAVIPNWFEDRYEPQPREGNGFRDVVRGRFTVSYFGNMGTAQDMETILGAIRILKEDPNVFFLFAGHGNKMERLKQIVQEEQMKNIAIYDFLHGEEFQDALAISDCALISLAKGVTGLCVPSKTYSYMMQGIPLLAIMDESDIVKDINRGAGSWVRNGEDRHLADTIRALSADPDKVRSMREICRELYLNNYTKGICTEKYVSLFRELL